MDKLQWLFVWLKDKIQANPKTSLFLIVAALVYIPYSAYQHMLARKAQELGEKEVRLDDQVDGVVAVLDNTDFLGKVRYQDGTLLPRDGLGAAVLTWADFTKAPDRLGGNPGVKGLTEKDFPVVAFFNSSAFDATGMPTALRRARDGSAVFQTAVRPVRLLLPLRSGDFKVVDAAGEKLVKADDWYAAYANLPPADQPTATQLDQLSDEQLQKLGLRRRLKADDAAGVRGFAVKVGGVERAVEPAAGVHLLVYPGEVKPVRRLEELPKNVDGVTTAADGSYRIPLKPGTYTLVVVDAAGVPHGNAVSDSSWPTFTVAENKWLDYEVRVLPPAGGK